MSVFYYLPQNAAALAAANAAAGRAAWEARAAENRASNAEKALADRKASIEHEKPAHGAAAKEKTMPDTNHAPTAGTAGGNMEKEKEKTRAAEMALSEKEREREREKERQQRERERAWQRQ